MTDGLRPRYQELINHNSRYAMSKTMLSFWPLKQALPFNYQEQLKEALKKYQSNIPNLKEWSQDYSIY
ncbi:hypothetical protein Gotur_034272 [Gossypium turneri]